MVSPSPVLLAATESSGTAALTEHQVLVFLVQVALLVGLALCPGNTDETSRPARRRGGAAGRCHSRPVLARRGVARRPRLGVHSRAAGQLGHVCPRLARCRLPLGGDGLRDRPRDHRSVPQRRPRRCDRILGDTDARHRCPRLRRRRSILRSGGPGALGLCSLFRVGALGVGAACSRQDPLGPRGDETQLRPDHPRSGDGQRRRGLADPRRALRGRGGCHRSRPDRCLVRRALCSSGSSCSPQGIV